MKIGTMAIVAAVGLTGCGNSDPGILKAGDTQVTLSDGPRLSAPRATHAMVRTSDGKLLAIGGCVSDGCEPGKASATVDILSPDGTQLGETAMLLEQRVQPSAIALSDGRALIIGGWIDGRVSASTELFDSRSRLSLPGPAMAGPRASASVIALPDGRVLIAGGYDGSAVRTDAEIFDPATNQLSPTGVLSVGRSGATASLLRSGEVLIVGGGDGESSGRRALASAEIYDPTTGEFRNTGSMAQRRYKHGAVMLDDGTVLVIGGSDERDYAGKLTSVELYDPKLGKFRTAGNLARPRFKLADGVMLIAPGKVLIGAGDERPEVFDVAAAQGHLINGSLDGQWNYMTLVRAGKRTALLAGGYREGLIEPTDRSWIVRF